MGGRFRWSCGEPLRVGVVACQVGSCCRQVTAITLAAAAVVAIVRIGNHSPRVVEGGGGCQVVVVVVVVNNNHVRSCLRVVKVGDSKQLPPSKTSVCVRSCWRWWWWWTVVARWWWQTATTLENKRTCSCSKVVKVGWLLKTRCKQNTVNEKYAGAPLHPLSSRCTTAIQNLFQFVRQW